METEQITRMRAGIELWERPGQLYVEVRNRAVGRGGVQVDLAVHQIYRLDEDNQLIEFYAFADPADARREAGLSDE